MMRLLSGHEAGFATILTPGVVKPVTGSHDPLYINNLESGKMVKRISRLDAFLMASAS
jgi:hypothetical protein